MKRSLLNFSTLATLLFFSLSSKLSAQFTQGNIVVYQVGDGSAALSSAATPAFLKEYTTAGAATFSVAIPTAGGARLTNSGSASAEGLITLSAGGQYIVIPGYDAAVGTATVASTISASTARVIDTVSFLALPGRAGSSSTAFSGSGIRSACSDGNQNYWAVGASSGVSYLGSASSATVSTSVTNIRGINIFNNKLYFITASGTRGVYQVGAGAPPITGPVTSTLVIATTAGGSPDQFVLNAAGNICYVADDNSSGGVQKWTYNGATWSLAYTLGTGAASVGAKGIIVDWSGPNPVIYGTSTEASTNRIFTVTDAGAGSAATTLATAATNTIFRGITFSPHCTAAAINSITSNSPICANQTLSLSANVTGSWKTSYSWSGTGTFSPSFTASNPTVTGAASGIYTLTATNSCGAATSTVNVTVNPLPTVSGAATSTLVCSGQPVTLTGSGAITYTWSNSVTDGVAFNPTSSNTYTVTGTDGNNCSNTATVAVNINALPNVTANPSSPSICMGNNLTLTGGGASTYTWSSSVTDGVAFTPTTTATYTVTGTDANSCINTATVNVVVNNLPNVTANPTPAAVCMGGNLTLNGGGATTYTWSSSVTNGVAFTPTTTATYTVTGTDANSCVNTATVSVAVNSLPTVVANTSSATVCMGNTVTLTGSGATTYTWSNGVTDGVAFTPTTTMTYTVTGADANCTNTATVSVVVNNLPSVTANPTPASVCMGDNLTLNGGGAATYTWSSSVTDGVAFTPTTTATYTVTGTDANSCVNTATVNVPVNNLPSVTANPTPAAVCMGTNLTLNGGGAATYTWSSSVTDGVAFTPTMTATYTVTGTDANSCVNTATVNVPVNSLPTVVANTSSATVCLGNTVTLSGSGATTYTWSNGVTDGVAFTPTMTVTYTVTGADANCSNTATVSATVNNLPSVTANPSASAICMGDNLTLNGGGAVTYAWSSSVTDGVAFTPSTTATYTVTGTDANSCVNTATVNVPVNSLPNVTANFTPNDTICMGDLLTLTGGGASTYTWTSGVTDGVAFTPTLTATYTVTGTDANACGGTASVQIVVNSCTTGMDQAISSALMIYPNPANNSLRVELGAPIGVISLLNSIGETVMQIKGGNGAQQMDVSSLPEGIYFVHVKTGGAILVKKFIVQH